MNILLIKLDATGDVVRTTPLLRRLASHTTWLSAPRNLPLIESVFPNLRCLGWDDRAVALDRRYDLAVNLEDTAECATFLREAKPREMFGAYLSRGDELVYTDSARGWFDMSLLSRLGRQTANSLKLANRRSYQDLVFEGLGHAFSGERYLLPQPPMSSLLGDVAIAGAAGPAWPMKAWAYYDELKSELEQRGLVVNYLPARKTLLEHLADIRNHRCLVSGDSLPMHLALGLGIPCVTIFNCTSPWEIHDYGLQVKIVSPLLARYFYRRDFDPHATRAIPLQSVFDAVFRVLSASPPYCGVDPSPLTD